MFILTKTKLELYANWLERAAPNAVVEGSSPFSSPFLITTLDLKHNTVYVVLQENNCC